jgi:putative N6-adenine-specific DNA methylase
MTLPAAFVKRIKRQVAARKHDFFAVTAPGLERICAGELTQLSPAPETIEAVTGGVAFTGNLTTLYLANLHLRTATRILMRLTTFKATRFDQLQQKLDRFAWELFLFRDTTTEIQVSTRHSRLYHRSAISERVARSVRARLEAHGQPGMGPPVAQRLHLRLSDDRVTVSLDSSGASLYQRGYKTQGARAPLRETLAAAILIWSGYQPGLPLVDPLCGAGTFSMEAALMALNIPPGQRRSFAFEGWPAFRPNHWNHLRRPSPISGPPQRPFIFASDHEAAACRALKAEVERNGLKAAISVVCRDFETLKPEHLFRQPSAAARGLVVLNPPYGVRLGSRTEARRTIAALGSHLRTHWKGWRVAAILPQSGLARHFGRPSSLRHLVHGGLPLTLMIGDIPRGHPRKSPPDQIP